MARMIPPTKDTCDFQAKGEEKVFDLLKKLPDDCLVFYEVVLGERDNRPDFMAIIPNRGVVILEVKDWGKETIRHAARREFEVKSRGGTYVRRKNPEWKSQNYLADAKESLSTAEELTDERGRLVFPLAYLVVMPNLNQAAFDQLGLEQVLERRNVVLQDEVASFERFSARIFGALPELKPELSARQVLTIRARLRNDISIEVPAQMKESVTVATERVPEDVFSIDLEQEILAKSLGEGPRLMRGIAGTGKTLIMLIRARLMASNAEAKNMHPKILVVCWNISLANYMRQIFDSLQGIPLKDKSGVQIMHFMQFARTLALEHAIAFPRASEAHFEEKVSRILSRLRVEAHERFSAIFVDEGQDFQVDWIYFLFHKMMQEREPKEKYFVVAADDAQRIYRSKDFSWAKLDIPMRGRSRILRRVYRNSARVWGFAAFLFGNSLQAVYSDVAVGELEFAPKPGYDPLLMACDSLQSQVTKVISLIQSRPPQYLLRNILILYRRAHVDGYAVIDDLESQLGQAGIAYQRITESNESKSTFVWADDCVKISTVHSAKGMDAPFVIVLGAEMFDDPDTDETRLMYVALTRAREYLAVLYSGNAGLVSALKRCQRLYLQVKNKLSALEKKAIGSSDFNYRYADDD